MKRSELLKKLARHLSNREVDDIYEDALLEMKFVQEAILERLPNQPWFLQVETIEPLPVGTNFIQLPANYNGLMTRGGVWFNEAELKEPCGLKTVNIYDYSAIGTRVDAFILPYSVPLDQCVKPNMLNSDGLELSCVGS